jgi:hypothetical protein
LRALSHAKSHREFVVPSHVESKWGIDHLCIEFQFDLARARDAQKELDELLKP